MPLGNQTNAWSAYMGLVDDRPELFRQGGELQIVLDRDEVDAFAARTGRTMGVVYSSPFHMMLVDLVRDPSGRAFAYERLVPAHRGPAVVAVPVHNGKVVLLEQYRHALRRSQLAFPRGFGEDGLSARENAAKELAEELGCEVVSAEELGSVSPDGGAQAVEASVLACQIDGLNVRPGYEEILRAVELTAEELDRLIADGKVDDGFTLAAWCLFRLHDTHEQRS